jgi:hypothetical protein
MDDRKDPLFLASWVFVKKPERIIALGLIKVLCLLVFGLTEFWVVVKKRMIW